jgi:CheY-like chemotaxis protein
MMFVHLLSVHNPLITHRGVELMSPRRILLVDDTLTIMKETSRALNVRGYIVETAAYGLGKFGMVLTDLQMPVMNGIEATRRYREFESEREKNSADASAVAVQVMVRAQVQK